MWVVLIRGRGSAIPERLQHVHCADVGSGHDCTELSCDTLASNLCAVVHLCLLSDAVSTDSRAANDWIIMRKWSWPNLRQSSIWWNSDKQRRTCQGSAYPRGGSNCRHPECILGQPGPCPTQEGLSCAVKRWTRVRVSTGLAVLQKHLEWQLDKLTSANSVLVVFIGFPTLQTQRTSALVVSATTVTVQTLRYELFYVSCGVDCVIHCFVLPAVLSALITWDFEGST
jgi:hypothetical protein